MKQIILFTFICLLTSPANAEAMFGNMKVGDMAFVSRGEATFCESEDRIKLQGEVYREIGPKEVTGCKYVEYAKGVTQLGKVLQVKDYSTKLSDGSVLTQQIVEVKLKLRKKRWFFGDELRAESVEKKEDAFDWFWKNKNNAIINERPVNLERWKKNLGNYEVLNVPGSKYHEAYYFPRLNSTIVLS
ncbi:MAG: hypothetical protein HAW64_05405, partial [Alphaproteobacteria bacterium]|nr:hypothetical protein [Alphaproteobacteria bacterium]